MTLALATIVDVTVILAAALSGAVLLRRRSAALRHAVICAGIVMALLAPALEWFLPQWPLLARSAPAATLLTAPVTFANGDSVTAAAVTLAVPASAPIAWTTVVFALWAAGAALGLAGLMTGFVRLRRIARRCRRVEDGPWHSTAIEIASEQAIGPVTLLRSAERTLLVTYGWLRPKIVLPSGSERWSEARCRVVLGHELAHIRRGDWATQMLAEALRILFWFHPLAWMACGRLRRESEYACDDAVMARGVDPTEYAAHLLDVARHAAGGAVPWAAAPAIAHPSTLERRIAVMLNRQRNHGPLGRRSAALVFGAALAVAVPVAAMSTAPGPQDVPPAAVGADVGLAPAHVAPPVAPAAASPVVANENVARAGDAPAPAAAPPAAAAQAKPASIRGTLYDPLGGRLPGVALTLTDQAVGVAYTATTDRNGSFTFNELQPAAYDLRAALPGFSTVSTVMPIGPGMNLDRHIVMPIGSLEETITVGCSGPVQPAASAPGAASPARLLQPRPAAAAPQPGGAAPFNGGIGGQIRAPRQIAKANPICPNHIGIDTAVLLSARVGIDGYLSDIKDLRNEGRPPEERQPQEIVDSAIEAVRLWQYTPTLLNGVPVEANMNITVLYTWQ